MTTICEKCHQEIQIGGWPFCPHPPSKTFYINSDEIPGGLEVKNGICNPDGTPRKYYSKSEIERAAYDAGWSVGDNTPKVHPRIQEERARARESRSKS